MFNSSIVNYDKKEIACHFCKTSLEITDFNVISLENNTAKISCKFCLCQFYIDKF